MSGHSEQRFKNTLVQREKEKIERDEKKTVRFAHPERISEVMHRSEFEKVTQTGFALLSKELAHQREAELARVALILVRREALRRVLEEERQLYAKELSQKGLAIYQQRI
ncbi:hypothetical protein PHYPO_G00006020 [Pangasianodon hypophthalmus]|uniref:Uncharacterized protein n=1 Tax=Pangasianodon hypophthalmus TaxID=310915 RepID=A0A5N5Q675_PANHP|nr:hypothetical protein PHYPO_G00006020 [Pangasianodon hypophthalmus]